MNLLLITTLVLALTAVSANAYDVGFDTDKADKTPLTDFDVDVNNNSDDVTAEENDAEYHKIMQRLKRERAARKKGKP